MDAPTTGLLQNPQDQPDDHRPFITSNLAPETTADIRLLPLSNTGANIIATPDPENAKEWIPPMLRKLPATLLILACLIMIGLLGVLNGVARHYNGFPLDDKIVVGVIRYLPTAMIVSFGFAWRCLIQDLKIITPYSVLSKGWSEAPSSLLLDYVDPIEPISIWKSARNRHWALFLAFVGGIMCSVLVLLANTITSVDDHSPAGHRLDDHSGQILQVNYTILVVMQCITALVGVVCGLCCTILRPRSLLTSDPSSFAAISVMLSTSGEQVESKLKDIARTDEDATEKSLRGWRWILLKSPKGPKIEGIQVEEQSSPASQRENDTQQPNTNNEPQTPPKGYQPFAFRLLYRLFLLILILAVITTLILLANSPTRDTSTPFPGKTIATAILLLLSYTLSSIHSALQTLVPYLALHQPSGSPTALTSTTLATSPFPLHAILTFKSIPLALTSLIALLFPALKILAAGLFVDNPANPNTGAVFLVTVYCLIFGFVMMSVVFCCFPRKRFLVKPVSCVAAQMSLVAGSRLVGELRREGVRDAGGTGIWERRFRLGWWGSGEGRRWGVDFIEE